MPKMFGRQDRVEGAFGGDGAEVNCRSNASQLGQHHRLVLQRRDDHFFARLRARHLGAVTDTRHIAHCTLHIAFRRGRNTRPRLPAAPITPQARRLPITPAAPDAHRPVLP